MKKIGFWKSEDEPNLPRASAFIDSSWEDYEKIVVLDYLARGEVVEWYKGSSLCRICGKENGSTEQSDGEYVWPSGLYHYVAHHNLKPPADFLEHVTSKQAEFLAKSPDLLRCGYSNGEPDLTTKEGRDLYRQRLSKIKGRQ